jgi:hypothetical protein
MHLVPCILDEKNGFLFGCGLFELDNTTAGRQERNELITYHQYFVEWITATKAASVTPGTAFSVPGLQLRGSEQRSEPVQKGRVNLVLFPAMGAYSPHQALGDNTFQSRRDNKRPQTQVDQS